MMRINHIIYKVFSVANKRSTFFLSDLFRHPISEEEEGEISGYRSSRWQMFFKIDDLKKFVTFIGKRLCWSLLLIDLQALGGINSIEKKTKFDLKSEVLWQLWNVPFILPAVEMTFNVCWIFKCYCNFLYTLIQS